MKCKINGQIVRADKEKKDDSSFIKETFDWLSAIIFACTLIMLIFTVFKNFTVNGESMLPTLHDGDKLLVNKFMYTPKKGDIVTINAKKNLDKDIIKRVIATGGDSFRINDDTHEVFVNGKPLDESYINEPTEFTGNWKIPDVIPQGYVLVMGDNRNNSLDSRFKEVGLIKINDIYGKAFVIYWPFNRIQMLS